MSKLLIIGGGPAGYETALLAKSLGVDVTLIEKQALGGVCLWEGCIPTKTLLHSASLYQKMQESDPFGIHTSDVKIDFQAVHVRKNGVIFRLHEGIKFRFEQAKIPILYGEATLIDAHHVLVNGQRYFADAIFLATGSHCRSLAIPGSDHPRVLNARSLLELQIIPDSLTIIGSGVIGVEFASLFSALGTKVTLLEAQPQILPFVDQEISKRLQVAFKRQKVEVATSVCVTQIEEDTQTLQVHYQEKNQTKIVTSDYVLVAIGRKPNVDTQSLDSLGIQTNAKGIVVNEHFQTSLPHIYAIGDVNGQSLLAHSAVFQGKVALHHWLQKPHSYHFQAIPNIIFSLPEIGYVGQKESDLIKGEYRVYKSLYSANCMASIQDETYGFAKIITDLNDIIIGAHIIGKDASLLLSEMVIAVQTKMTLPQFQTIIHAHPTLSELWQDFH